MLEAAAARFPNSNDLLTASMGGSNKKKNFKEIQLQLPQYKTLESGSMTYFVSFSFPFPMWDMFRDLQQMSEIVDICIYVDL